MNTVEHFCYRCEQFKQVPKDTDFDAPCLECTEARELARKALYEEGRRYEMEQRLTHYSLLRDQQ